ncbi:Translin-associated factor X-interacting protein 1 [Eumeta japonica]|uniref:Translin-associated factor X-interacting protein 1 n=1 Tax=Eumeta variegata TaxID=151549 RepID=A0A4C1V124_EUMVA|nr:Translin-associated factor X-interacting protein 1 [Eumeta japonica]
MAGRRLWRRGKAVRDGEKREMSKSFPKFVSDIQASVDEKLKKLKKPESELLKTIQSYYDEVLEIYRDAYKKVIEKTVTYSNILSEIKSAYENAIEVRNERITQFIAQDRIFGITARKKDIDANIKSLEKERKTLKQEKLELSAKISALSKEIEKMKDEKFSEHLELMKERDARYNLYWENVELQQKLQELQSAGVSTAHDARADPVLLRIALDRCREQLSITQKDLKKMTDEYAETVPRREYDALQATLCDDARALQTMREQFSALQEKHKKILACKNSLEEELTETKERVSELERAGTPRPQWDVCGDFIGGGRARWRQLARGLSSREALLALLKELGPAATTQHLEHFDGLGTDPVIPPYLRYEGQVRNLRLSRREVSVIINDIWLGKIEHGRGMSMQDYVTKYFEDRYQQPSVRAEWAYNLCSGAEQMLDEPQVKLFWGILHGHLSEDIYLAYRTQWYTFRDNLYKQSRDGENINMDEFERATKATFPLKSEVDIKNIIDVVRKQLKMKIVNVTVNLDKLFQENDEGFDRCELARELFRQRQVAQDKYVREVLAELGGRRVGPIADHQLKRAFAIVDPAIDHVRMEYNIRWVFSQRDTTSTSTCPLPLRTVAMRLASGNIERMGARYRGTNRRTLYK